MLVNWQPFNNSTIRNAGLRPLRADAGNCTLLPEFRHVRFPHSRYIWRLLYHGFFCQSICCFLTGNFVLYMAGVYSSYTIASLFIAITGSLLRRIFRQDPDPLDNFYIYGFLLEYVDVEDEDIFYYISCDDIRMTFVYYMTDTTTNCDNSSNLDFVRFIWRNYERFNFVKCSDLRSPWISFGTRVAMFKILQGRVRRMERQYTLRLVCHEVSVHYVIWPNVSVSMTVAVLSADVNLPPCSLRRQMHFFVSSRARSVRTH
jgi:hypothetical protein